MNIILLSDVVKSQIIYNPKLSPFHDNFNVEILHESVHNELERIKLKFPNYKLEGNAVHCIRAVFTIYEQYNSLLTDLVDLILSLNLPDQELVELILKESNSKSLFVTNKINSFHADLSLNKKITAHLKLETEINEKNVFGHTISLGDAIDIIVDSTSELINIVREYNDFKQDRVGIDKNSDSRNYIIQLLIGSNLIYLLKEIFDAFLFDGYDINYLENEVKLSFKYDNSQLLKYIGKNRYRNHIFEALLNIRLNTDEKFRKPKFWINNGLLSIKSTHIEDQNDSLVNASSAFVNYFFYFGQYRLKGLGGITVSNLFTFFSHLQAAFLSINLESDEFSKVKYNEIELSPIKIEKRELISYLQNSTGFKKLTIEKILGFLSSGNETLDLWKTPLIPFKKFYFFKLTSIAGGHISYWADIILSQCLSEEIRLKYFRKTVINELKTNKCNYLYEQLLINDTHNNIIVYKLKNEIAVISLFLYDFPINSKEYNTALLKAQEAADKLSLFLNSPSCPVKSTINILLTKYPFISGQLIDSYPILDLTLLNNYIHAGEFKKARVMGGKDRVLREKGSVSYSYYNNEDEFNSNFRRFCFEPNPIREFFSFLNKREVKIFDGILEPGFYKEIIDDVNEELIISKYIEDVDFYLGQLFYFDNEMEHIDREKDKEFIESRLAFLIPQLFTVTAFDSKDSTTRLSVIRIFQKYRMLGISHLIFTTHNFLRSISIRKPKKYISSTKAEADQEFALRDFQKILQGLKPGTGLNLNLALEHDFSDERVDAIVQVLINAIGAKGAIHRTLRDIEEQLYYTIIFAALVRGQDKYRVDLGKAFVNLIDVLNNNSLFQKARDYAEEILIYTFTNDSTPIVGWICLLKCYTKQGDVFEGFGYANLILSILDTMSDIDDHLVFDSMYNLLLLYREIGYPEISEEIFNFLQTLDLSTYDSQKIHLSYYNGFLAGEISILQSKLSVFNTYLDANIKGIIEFGQHGIVPWVAFLLNINRFLEKGILLESGGLISKLEYLSKELDLDTFRILKAQILGEGSSTTELFLESLGRAFQTRSYENLMYEIGNLIPLAKNVAIYSLQNENYDHLLLTGLVLNNQRLVFKGLKVQSEFVKFDDEFENELLKNKDSYEEYILSKLVLKEGQLFCWLFESNHNCYALTINTSSRINVIKLDWNLFKMKEWLSKLDNFYFPDNAQYSINVQEDDYVKIHNEVAQFILDLSDSCTELLICSSLSLAEFPFNLISTSSDNIIERNLTKHEDRVGDYILQNHSDFLSYHIPISNVISLEWFINCEPLEMSFTGDLKIEGWCPIIDEDMTLLQTYEKLKPIIEVKHTGKIHTGRIPDNLIDSSVNFFLAHGGKGVDGFKAVYTRENNGAAINREGGVKRIFGKGDVAVLFICNSANVSKELFAESLVSFVSDVLDLGYKTVIAPAWSLHPFIAPEWTEKFLIELKAGKSVSIAAHLANIYVSKVGYDDYSGYYSPTGWASMHVYGNPNVRYQEII